MAAVGFLAGIARESGGDMSAEIKEYELKNGLKVIAKEIHGAPVVSVFIWYRVGSRNEPPGQSGLAHFLEHMMFKGTTRFAKGEIARLIGRTGGRQNAFTSYDYTAYFETVPSGHLDLALEIEADRMRNALLDPREVESERTVILSELDGGKNNPQVRLRELVNAQAWLKHAYRRPIIGWREEVEKLSVKQLRAFYNTYYQPHNATLVVVGDFNPKHLRSSIQRLFGPISPVAGLKGIEPADEIQRGERRVVLNDHGPAAMVMLKVHIPPAGHEDHYALTVLNDALTKGKTSRLYKALVDKGLATGISGAPYEMIDPGSWVFTAICQQGVDPRQVEEVMRREFERVKKELLASRELQRSINQTRAQLIYSKDSLTDQAMILGFYQTVAGDWRLPDLYPARVAAVTPKQVQQSASRYLVPQHMIVGHFIPLPGSLSGPVGVPPSDIASAFPDSQGWSMPALRDSELPGPTRMEKTGSSRPAQCKRYTLSNGLVLLLQANKSNPSVALSGLVRAGMAVEPASRPGVAIVHAAMLDRGTAKRSAAQLAGDLEFKAASLEYSAGREELKIFGEALSGDLELLLKAVAETLSMPAFPEKELKKVKKEVLTNCRVAQDSAEMQAWQGFAELAYPTGHPMRRSLIQAAGGIRKLTRRDVTTYHQEWIRPDQTILSLAGDFEPDQVFRMAQRLFKSWQVKSQAPVREISPMETVSGIKTRRKTLPGKSECLVVLGHEGIHRLDSEYYSAYVANHVLGGAGLSSLLMRTVRDQEGLTYSIYSQFKLSHGVRPWCLIFQANPENVSLAVEKALAQVRRLQTGKVAGHMLKDGQEQLAGGLALSLETNAGLAYINREVEYHKLGPDYLQEFPRAVRAVTYTEMIRAAGKWFHPDKYLLSIAGPKLPDQ